ncbi:phosphoenolpyruvate--protein phosphotransferase [uncultured Anaeromusa sp.]|uniref:phosphoenolpyruvate--protein phosphotransferase n=1 Tax=uncultured Anaeromusa sp. TaxID=673273 RepID=UPI0029C75573|nr:phosphoenolpyruvate--protein phosphotransferase [uncultured Anaeromusa sp.]
MTEVKVTGIGVSEGVRIGKAFRYERAPAVQFRQIDEQEAVSEVKRLTEAKEQAIKSIEELSQQAKATIGEEKAGIIEAQKSFLQDPAFCPEMEKLIGKSLISAEAAVDQVVKKFAAIFEAMPNEYMQERAADVKDVGVRLLQALSGVQEKTLENIRSEVILLADDLAPSDTIQLNKNYVLAFATQKGGKTSHTAIFAKTLGVPAVIGLGAFLEQVQEGDSIIVDGGAGICILRPAAETIKFYEEKQRQEMHDAEMLEHFANEEAVTRDGYRVEIGANIGTAADAEFALEQGAEGVGLLRTELVFMAEERMPDEETQVTAYKSIVQSMGERPVIIRTLDIGGDKALSYLHIPQEMNPFLGYRAIRLCLDQKDLFVTQLRAILRASAFGKVKIMFPMISCMEEWRTARAVVEEVKQQLREEQIAFDEAVEVGMMVEIPAAAIMAGQFAKEVDFFSIGTNDLVQYTLAVDRMNEKIDYLYDHFHPAVLQLLQHVAVAAKAEGKFVGMCGGMAGEPKAVPLLVALGLDELSMSATSIRKVKCAVSKLELAKCQELLEEVMKMSTAQDVRQKVEEFCKRHEIY